MTYLLLFYEFFKTGLFAVGGGMATIVKFCAFIGTVYSLYALYAAGFEAMMYGSLATFAGWAFFGVAAERLHDKEAAAAA